MTDRDTPHSDGFVDGAFTRVDHTLDGTHAIHIVRGTVYDGLGQEGDAIIEMSSEGGVAFGIVGLGRIALAEGAVVTIRPAGVDRLLTELDRERVRADMAEVALTQCMRENSVLAGEIDGLREENERLHAEALVDPLTKLGSERALEERYERLNEAIRIDQEPPEEDKPKRPPLRFSFAYIDYDGFGDINTAVGHPTADRLLIILGRRLKAAIRPEDDIFRKGGDEGIIIMIDQNLRTKQQRADFKQRIDDVGKQAFEEFAAELEAGGRINELENLRRIALVGYSVGIANYNRRRHRSMEGVERAADDDLFVEKENRKIAAGIDPRSRTNVLPDNPMVGVLHSRTKE